MNPYVQQVLPMMPPEWMCNPAPPEMPDNLREGLDDTCDGGLHTRQ